MYFKDDRKFKIRKFLLENGPSGFGEISKHLHKIGLGYKGRKGLAKTLKTLADEEFKIKKKDQKPYPVYSVVKDSDLEFAIMGERFLYHLSNYTMGNTVKIDENYWKDDVNFSPDDNFESKFVKTMVTRYGFFLLSVFVKSFDQAVSKKKFDRKIWIDHAMDILSNEQYISRSFLNILFGGGSINLKRAKDKQMLKNKLIALKDVMREMYPKLYQNIDYYENVLETNKKVIKDLSQEEDFLKNIKLE